MNLKEEIINGVVLLSIFWFLLTFFTPDLMLSKTITTGGDTASHYYTAEYMKDYLLPNGKLFGWTPGNYAGFPILQFYFPPPFLFMVLLSYSMPLEVSFKIISVLGTFLLPLFAFFSMRFLNFKFPMPVISAIFTLSFLFMEANSMWGGNIPSTLAGEFSYSLSLSLTVLFFGTIYKGLKENKYRIWNSLLLALIAFTHVYTLIFSIFSSLFLLLMVIKDRKELISRIKYLSKTYLLAFLLVAFWIVPMIAKLKWTTSYDLVWIIYRIEEVFPYILLPFIALAVIGFYKFVKERDEEIGFLYFSLLVAGIFYFFARYLGVVDIRFIPFIQLYLMFCGAYGFSWLVSKFRAVWLVPIIILFLVIFWVNNNQIIVGKQIDMNELIKNDYHGFTKFWIKWNYEGFQGKSTWNQFSEINNFLGGSFNDSRVVYEHSELHNSFGSSRAFESLQLFAGRATLEGLYMQSSVSAPFIFYIQSEISEVNSCPFYMNYPCTQFNMEKGTEHLKIFNVGQFIARSEKAKNALRNYTEYKLAKKVGEYEIYDLTTNENRYVIVPEYEPILFKTNNWKQVSYDWFRNFDIIAIPLVFINELNERDSKNFKLVIYNLNDTRKIPLASNCSISESVREEEIRFKTNCIGKPHIIRISDFPDWRVEGAEKIYLVSPSFMLVFPEKENVRIYYDTVAIDWIGILLTLIGILIVLYIALSRIHNLRRFFRR